jgi:hypothetical protein
MTATLDWLGIALCLSQAAILSGLNLSIFSISRLRLEVEAAGGDVRARNVLQLRRNANFTLATIIWGNVAANVLLTLLSRNVLAGVLGFVLSTVLITCFGEIAPQAYFSRHALAITARLRALLRFYSVLLYPVARPTGWLLDRWLGPEAITYLRERDFRALITQHVKAAVPEVGALEGTGALNFLDLDDIPVGEEGAPLDPASVIALPFEGERAQFPPFAPDPNDAFLRRVHACGRHWVIITDQAGRPRLALDAHRFLRAALLEPPADPQKFLHRPVIATDERTTLGNLIGRLTLRSGSGAEDVIENEVILLWARRRRILTGADLLGRLLRGIAQR